MLYPINNAFRQSIDLSGIWQFRADPENTGIQGGWSSGFDPTFPIAVPASWNEQFANLRDFLGPAWYQTTFNLPWDWGNQAVWLRFNAVNYLAEVWLNGESLGTHEGGHLPFRFKLNGHLNPEDNLLVVRVDGELAPDRVPPGNVTGSDLDFFVSHSGNFPQAQFDFFPFCGIQRPVLLYCEPHSAITDLTVFTSLDGKKGELAITIEPGNKPMRVSLSGINSNFQTEGKGTVSFSIPDVRPWFPDDPFLYELTIEMLSSGSPIDAYKLPVGVRTIVVEGDQLLLNGKPVYLHGFGRHEDFPIHGRGYDPAVLVKDYSLMKWVGANSFRTSHYPYSEQMMDWADRLGFLIIDETPAVGLFFNRDGFEKRLALCRQYTRELIQRDKNHPSVIAWSLANEPHSGRDEAKPFFHELSDIARQLDPSRPVTLVSFLGLPEESFEYLDIVCLNRYFGWYQESGQIDRGIQFLSTELNLLYEKFHKPIILTEFGADAIPGQHAQPAEMFSEEYQADFISAYIQVLRSKPYVIGEHVWNMCDFKTSQGISRMGGYNYKGVFTRDRRPKLAAHRLKEIWKSKKE